ncbi:flagellar biosynthetic protein FliR [Rubellimicrobium sp. CFH 75288]|uniref:flagellar biosynthetic protein FliR n=1 Tax=Rubellimicrobium sp. CFH 75288 TaxID=2697034 RepID=UPI001411D278|nr:flagellar biosynthetic protein FliR [Rubellimicrobium sp. CFH 75288]NAZ37285.1 type III secretion protein [Rubellimicrobium sp. CFH 75288]
MPPVLEALGAILPQAGVAAWTGFLVFLRVGATVALLPLFGEAGVSPRLKLAAALAFSLLVAPALGPLPHPPQGARLLVLLLGEAACGVVFGALLRLVVLALQTAGTIMAQASSLSQILGSAPMGEPSPAMGQLLLLGGLALAGVLGLHVHACAFLISTYALVPAGSMLDPGLLLEVGLREAGRTFALAVSLAAPFLAAALLYNLALGAMHRAMPQLSVTFVGAPVLTFGGILLLLATAPALLVLWAELLRDVMARPFEALP